jgi:hypothetical protein
MCEACGCKTKTDEGNKQEEQKEEQGEESK